MVSQQCHYPKGHQMTPLQKLHAIRMMYSRIDEHLVRGAHDSGARMDLEGFYDLTVEGRATNGDLLKGIGPRYDRMVKIYTGLLRDVSVYVSERRKEARESSAAIDLAEREARV